MRAYISTDNTNINLFIHIFICKKSKCYFGVEQLKYWGHIFLNKE